MKKGLIALIMIGQCMAMTSCEAQKLSSFANASPDTGTHIAGFETILGVSTNNSYSIAGLAAYIGATISGQNIGNTDLTLSSNRQLNFDGDTLHFFKMGVLYGTQGSGHDTFILTSNFLKIKDQTNTSILSKDSIYYSDGTNSVVAKSNGITTSDGAGDGCYASNNGTGEFTQGSNKIVLNPNIQLLYSSGPVSSIMEAQQQQIDFDYTNTGNGTTAAFADWFPNPPTGVATALNWFRPLRSGTYQLSGDGIAPSVVLGPGAGTPATFSFAGMGDDRHGRIQLNCGTGAVATSTILTLTFTQAYSSNVAVIVQIRDFADLYDQVTTYTVLDGGNAIFAIQGTLTDSHVYLISYIVQN